MQRRTFLKSTAFGAMIGAGNLWAAEKFDDTENSVITIHLQGGISAVEFINPIPLAPIEFRSTRGYVDAKGGYQLGGDFKEMAKIGDKLSVVRSMRFKDANHQTATMAHITSHFHVPNSSQMEPSFGSLVAHKYQPNNPSSGMPHYVKLRNIDGDDSSWLGIKYAGYDADDQGVKNMKLSVSQQQFERRLKMMKMIDSTNVLPGLGENWTELKEMAVNIVNGSAAEAFDLSKEVKHPYMETRFGKDLLLARRLVERGCRYVSLNSNSGWDFHSDASGGFARSAPELDLGIATLIKDLEDRGLLNKTLVVVWSEFSRTKLNNQGGKDHNPGTNSLILAGGNYNHGRVIGATDRNGLVSEDNVMSVKDLAWTIGDHTGLDKKLTINDSLQRPRHIFENNAKNILNV